MRLLVAGSAHIDILSKGSGDPAFLDQIGSVDLVVGGTACNLALNFRKLGLDVSLLTATGRSLFSTFVINHLSRAGVSVLVDHNDDLPLAAFSAHISSDGELLSAVSSTPVDRHSFSEEVIAAALEDVDALVLDCNLSEAMLLVLARAATERMLPVYVAGVSEQKCVRIRNIASIVDAIFLNEIELSYLMQQLAPTLNGRLLDLATTMGTTFVVTQGKRGALVARPGCRITAVPATVLSGISNTLGMGDAFMAGTIFAHLCHGFSIHEGATAMLPLVARTAHQIACNDSTTSDLSSMLSDLERRACFCPTTGILNRSATEGAMETMVLNASNTNAAFSVAIIDVDYFKTINDSFGHSAGDQVLERVAGAIRSTLRQHDKVGRWGGDEFVALLFGDADVGVQVGDRIRRAVLAACEDICTVTLSIGVAQWHGGMSGTKDLLEDADRALYYVKRNGRDGCMSSARVSVMAA